MWYYNYTERLETLLSNECRSLFSSASFLVSTLSGIVARFVRLAAFLFIGIKVRPPLCEDGLLLFMEVFYGETLRMPESITC